MVEEKQEDMVDGQDIENNIELNDADALNQGSSQSDDTKQSFIKTV